MSDKEQPKDQPEVTRMSDIKSDVTEEELTKLLAKVDKESTFRKLTGYQYRIVYWIAVAFSVFPGLHGPVGGVPGADSALDPFVVRLCARLPPLSLPNQDRPEQAPLAGLPLRRLHGLRRTVPDIQLHSPHGDRRGLYEVRHDRRVCGTLLTLEAARRVVGMPITIVASSFLAIRVLRGLLSRLSHPPWLFDRANRFPHVFHDRGNPGHPPGCVLHLHLLVHSVRRVPREDRHRQALY